MQQCQVPGHDVCQVLLAHSWSASLSCSKSTASITFNTQVSCTIWPLTKICAHLKVYGCIYKLLYGSTQSAYCSVVRGIPRATLWCLQPLLRNKACEVTHHNLFPQCPTEVQYSPIAVFGHHVTNLSITQTALLSLPYTSALPATQLCGELQRGLIHLDVCCNSSGCATLSRKRLTLHS